MDHDDFAQAFIKALQNQSVITALKQAFTSDLLVEINELKVLVKEKDEKIKHLNQRVSDLEIKSDDLEQYSRRNSLRVYGIQEREFENPVEITREMFKQELDIDIQPQALDRVHRVGKKSSNEKGRPLLVKFATYRDRDQVYRAKSRLKKDQASKTIFINEDLTRPRAQLLFLARRLKRDKKISDCWTHDGKILIKNGHGKIVPINKKEQLEQLA